ncbi:MAG: preprotein translocase subunit SecE [bacterium]
MSQQENSSSGLDILMLLVALLILVAGIWGFYHYEQDYLLWMRFLGIFAMTGVAAFVAAQSTQGKNLVGFISGSRTEIRKVVWPTKQESIQTTLIVIVVVIIASLFLALVDFSFSRLVEWLVSTGN